VFGRRKRQADGDDYEPGYDDQLDDYGAEEEYGGGPEPGIDGGPWDSAEPYPELSRVDLGSLQIPVGPEYELQLVLADQQGAWVTVHHRSSDIQLQAFAAPRTGALWDEVRDEIAAEIASAGGTSAQQDGPFGPEVFAHVPSQPGSTELQPVRFIGADGPRWFLRGLISGAAATSEQDAAPLEDLFRQIVVVRGDHPVPPRDLLELRLPADAQQQLAEQQEQEQGQGQGFPNRLERGPEFTETR
jgi:hypothetical protein